MRWCWFSLVAVGVGLVLVGVGLIFVWVGFDQFMVVWLVLTEFVSEFDGTVLHFLGSALLKEALLGFCGFCLALVGFGWR